QRLHINVSIALFIVVIIYIANQQLNNFNEIEEDLIDLDYNDNQNNYVYRKVGQLSREEELNNLDEKFFQLMLDRERQNEEEEIQRKKDLQERERGFNSWENVDDFIIKSEHFNTELEELEELDKIFYNAMKEKEKEKVIDTEITLLDTPKNHTIVLANQVIQSFKEATSDLKDEVDDIKEIVATSSVAKVENKNKIEEKDLLFIVLTSEVNQGSRVRAILNTWGNNTNSKILFFTRTPSENLKNLIVLPKQQPVYNQHKELFWDALKYAYFNVQPKTKAKWIITVTDRTYINIKAELDYINFKEGNGVSWYNSHILGKCLKTSIGYKLTYTDGATGNMLSSKLIETLHKKGYFNEDKSFLKLTDELHLSNDASLGFIVNKIFGDTLVYSCGFKEDSLFHHRCHYRRSTSSSVKCKSIDCVAFSSCTNSEMQFWNNHYNFVLNE
ncbi:hypothetical protein HDU92_008510, partial [Lobulomyces angularis]